jgi:hypothetical protein
MMLTRQLKLAENSAIKVQDWIHRDQRYQSGLIAKWEKDIQRQKEHVATLNGI